MGIKRTGAFHRNNTSNSQDVWDLRGPKPQRNSSQHLGEGDFLPPKAKFEQIDLTTTGG